MRFLDEYQKVLTAHEQSPNANAVAAFKKLDTAILEDEDEKKTTEAAKAAFTALESHCEELEKVPPQSEAGKAAHATAAELGRIKGELGKLGGVPKPVMIVVPTPPFVGVYQTLAKKAGAVADPKLVQALRQIDDCQDATKITPLIKASTALIDTVVKKDPKSKAVADLTKLRESLKSHDKVNFLKNKSFL